MSSKGQIVLPAEIRQQDRIEPGQEFDIERLDRSEYRIKRRSSRRMKAWSIGYSPVPGRAFSFRQWESTDAL